MTRKPRRTPKPQTPCPAAETSVRTYLAGLDERGEKVPAQPGYPTRPWLKEIARRAGAYALFLSKPAGRSARHAVDLAVKRLGLSEVRPQLDREILTVTAAGGAWCATIREEQAALGEYTGPQLADARHLIALLERRTRDLEPAEANLAVAALQQAIAIGKIRNASEYATALAVFSAFLQTQTSRLALPSNFHGALELAMAASGLSAGALARRLGVRPTQIVRWRSGERIPDANSDSIVAVIERELSLEAGELSQRIERRRAGRGRVPRGFFPHRMQSHDNARRRSEIARRLPVDVMAMDTAARHALMETLDATIDAEKSERVARNALRQDRYALRTWPAAADEEFKSFAAYKADLIPGGGFSRNRKRNRLTTVGIRRQQIALYYGYLCDRADESNRIGLTDLSLLLLIVPSRLEAYMRWKAERVAIGKPRLSATDVDFVTLAASLLHPVDGYLPQRSDWRPRLNELIGRYDLKIPRRGEGYWKQVSADDWRGFCDDAYTAIKRLETTLRRGVSYEKRLREFFPALELPDPLTVIYRAIDAMRSDMEALDRDSLSYARAQRALLMVQISTQVPLRVETWVQLSVGCADADLSIDGLWRLKIPADKLKTGDIAERYRRDGFYRRTLRDDNGLYEDIEEYTNHSRPMLLGDADCDLLIVNNAERPGFSKAYLSNVIRDCVRRYISREATNENAKLGLEDFSLHGFRHFLATTILKRTGSYELAADGLGVDPATIRKYYGMWEARDREDPLLQALGRRVE